ncbi:hypothetical protein RN001_006351 [Aquatica leii]|uniref:Fibronectin type-III domain-containing protein n=1 Tax=Aquatica leii TaxID=1421715 RepID=A0AAN7PDE3_9COLE|nr:hypothetical protein RN001_006351 [Aquatica leii]
MCGISNLTFLWICTFIAVGESYNGDDKYTPKDFCVRLITNNSVLIRWVEPVTLRSEIQGYTVYYTNDTRNLIEHWNSVIIGNYPMTTVRNINLGETYHFRVRVNALGLDKLGPLSDVFSFRLINRTRSCYDKPETATINTPNMLRATATSYSSVEVWWNLPYDPHQVKGFMVLYGTSELGYWSNKTTKTNNFVELTNLEKSTTYTITIAAITDNGLKYYPNEVKVNVSPEEVPMEVEVIDVTGDSMVIKWLPPLRLHPAKYKIVYYGVKDYVDADGAKQRETLNKIEETVDGHVTTFELVDLYPYTHYYVNISAVPIDLSYRPFIKINATTDVGPPGPMRRPIVNGLVAGGNIQILLPKASEENGPVSYYYVIVVPEQGQDPDLPTEIYATDHLLENQWLDEEEIDVPYIAAKFSLKIPYAFILGVGVHGGFKNYPLHQNKKYRVFVRAVVVTPHGQLFTDSPYSDYFSLIDERKKYLKLINN